MPDRILFLNINSQLMKHVKKYSSAERMREYAEKHAPVRGAVVYQEQARPSVVVVHCEPLLHLDL